MSITLIPVKLFLRALPDSVHGRFFSRILTQLLRGQPLAKKLKKLHGKVLQLTFTDSGNSWRCIIEENKIKADLYHLKPVDIHIRGSLKNFLLLATHNEDPDTLFFNQELSLEGNTEDGLYLRNILDAMDFDTKAHLQDVFTPRIAAVVTPVIERINIGSRLQTLARSML